MPNLTGIPALDVAIGLSFIFLLLSLVASACQEFIANILSLRSKVLERGLRNMLSDTSQAPPGSPAMAAAVVGSECDLLFRVYAHPLIRSLYRESWFPAGRKTLKPAAGTERAAIAAHGAERVQLAKVRLPSYISPRSFALALMDTIAPDVTVTDPKSGLSRRDRDIIKETHAAILAMHIPSAVKHRLLALLDDARGDIDVFRSNVEAWFDDTMARVSGWYKRRAQLIIVLIAVVLTVAMNANTLTVGERLWRDPTVRATVVQQAAAASAGGKITAARLNRAVDDVEKVAKGGIPIGWSKSRADPRHITLGSVGGWAHLLGGWLLTIIAVSLGAPFWFDTLSRLSQLRGTGKPEAPLPSSSSVRPGERVVTQTPPVDVTLHRDPAGDGAVAATGGP
jgi:hypothetical protein